MARTRSLVRLKRLLDEWRARGDTARALGLSDEGLQIPSISGARTLIVDDWDMGGQTIQEALSREGVVCDRARSTAEAISLTRSNRYDLVVVSLSMVEEDPLKLVAMLRASDKTHETPVLLVADPEERERVLRGFELGASDWLTVPVDENELRVRARNQIRRKFYQDRLRSDLGNALEMALIDPLTGLYNQRYLRRHLSGLVDGGQGRQLCVLMVDVDHFKSVNDRFGHAAGDLALKLIAQTLRANTRVFDSLARYGGEEFVVIMPGATREDALSAGERLRASVEELKFRTPAGQDVPLTASIGIACSGNEAVAPDILLNAADTALYAAKRNGRNRVEIAASLESQKAG
jgi:two-component system cell cycle response regulator